MLHCNPFVLLSGVLVDMTHNYGSAFYSCAAGMALSAVFLGLVRPAKRGLLCRRRNSKQPRDTQVKKTDSEEQSAVQRLGGRTYRPEDCSDDADDNLIHAQAEATRDVEDVIRFA